MKVRCYVMLGGIWGFDGSAFSRGMSALSGRLNALKDVTSSYHYWTAWKWIEDQIEALPKEIQTAVIGYSGGGSRLTWINTPVDLAVGYDPSPIHQTWDTTNYSRVLCYHNQQVNYFMGMRLGGGQYHGKYVETTEINMNHMVVQFSEDLHQKTIAAVEQLKVPVA